MSNIQRLIWTGLIMAVMQSCSNNYTPKPKGYVRIDLPAKSYQNFTSDFPYTFEYPVYGAVVRDTQPNAEPFWINVEFPSFQAKIHLSYKSVKSNLNGFIEDSHVLAYKHAVKAEGIDELPISYPQKKVYGLIYQIEGNAASSYQFYVTDSNKHFLRGSLYFNAHPNKDSLAPVIQFFRADILHIIETFQWK